MIKEKTYVKNVFDEEILKPGTKITAKYTDSVYSDGNNIWNKTINAKVIQCFEEVLYIEDLENISYDDYNDNWHKDGYCIEVEKVKLGFWKIELMEE